MLEVNIPMLVHAVLQSVLAFSTLLAFFMVMRLNNRWGAVIGLAAQPLWLYEHWSAGQFGMLVVAILFTIFWAAAVWEEFPIVRRLIGRP